MDFSFRTVNIRCRNTIIIAVPIGRNACSLLNTTFNLVCAKSLNRPSQIVSLFRFLDIKTRVGCVSRLGLLFSVSINRWLTEIASFLSINLFFIRELGLIRLPENWECHRVLTLSLSGLTI